MTDLSKRIRATRLLRDIFIISLIVTICSTIVTMITVALWDLPVIPQAAGITVSVLVTIFDIMSVVVIVLIAATFVLTINYNKQCRYAFFLVVLGAILMILAAILQNTLVHRVPAYVVNLFGELMVAVAIYTLIDGLYNHEYRKTSFIKYVGMGCILMELSALFELIAFATKVNAGFTTMFYGMSLASSIAYSVILLISMNSALKDSRMKKASKELEESEAL